jgi:aminoglycoside phosphotransferase family enzyme/predicted kinase
MNTQLQTEIFEAMARPDFYPHHVSTIEQRETHISKVFLTGEFAYKIKKPVSLEFLDFTTLARRKHYCQQEVILNQCLTRGIYLYVVPITLEKGKYFMAGPGETVEYAVKMRQLPEKLSMLQLAHRGKLDRDSIDELARVLAGFYRQSSTNDNINKIGAWSTIWTNTEENFNQTEQFAGSLLDQHMFQIIRAATLSFLIRRKVLFEHRVEHEKIRDCHGDLRSGHIYFFDGIQIIDCIEFNDRFRYSDITSDLAFLTMDLDFEGYPRIAQDFINSFLDYTRDEEMLVLLDFYKCYRAFVRAKVNCLYLQGRDASTSRHKKLLRETRRYLNLAYRYAVQFTRPTVWVICGLPAAGKTATASMMAKMLGLAIFHTDVVRKTLFNLPLDESQDLPFEEGIYSKECTALVYGKLLMLAQEEIERGRSIILDGTFSRRHQREEALRLARDMDANIIVVECTASNETLKTRLAGRSSSTTISDARLNHLKQFRARFEPINDLPAEIHIRLNSELARDEILRQILSHEHVMLSRNADVVQKIHAMHELRG